MKDSISYKTGEYEKKQRLTPNWVKIMDYFIKNYKHHKLEEKEITMSDDDNNNLVDLMGEYGEEQLIKFIADSLIEKQKIINYNLVGVDGL
jgi:hypothetical protein